MVKIENIHTHAHTMADTATEDPLVINEFSLLVWLQVHQHGNGVQLIDIFFVMYRRVFLLPLIVTTVLTDHIIHINYDHGRYENIVGQSICAPVH